MRGGHGLAVVVVVVVVCSLWNVKQLFDQNIAGLPTSPDQAGTSTIDALSAAVDGLEREVISLRHTVAERLQP